jgi:hypothetical protein
MGRHDKQHLQAYRFNLGFDRRADVAWILYKGVTIYERPILGQFGTAKNTEIYVGR